MTHTLKGAERICLGPEVSVVVAPQFIPQAHFPIPDDGTDSEKAGAYAAKRCYRSAGKNGRSNTENQRHVVAQKHGSVLAHLSYALDISGITRAASLELNRHGLNISQESTRYVDVERFGRIVLEPFFAYLWYKYFVVKGNVWFEPHDEYPNQYFLIGPDISGPEGEEPEVEWQEQLLLVEHVNEQLSTLYSYDRQVDMLQALNPNKLEGFDLRKWARGKARNTLAHGLETAGVWSGGLRMWRNVIEQRSDRQAEPEIRRLAQAIFNALQPFSPVHFEDYAVTPVDGIFEFHTPHRKI